MKKFILFLVPLLFTCPAFADVSVIFSGANGAPLSLTIDNPVQFTITAAVNATNVAPFFVLDGTGGTFGLNGTTVTGNISYSINGGAALPITRFGSGTTGTDVTADDSYLIPASRPTFSVGDVLVLSAGTITTTSNIAGAPPASATYQSFASRSNGVRISSFAAPVPEPGTVAILGLGLMALTAKVLRRRK